MRKLKAAEVATVRNQMLLDQGMKCQLCQLPMAQSVAVLDHDHSTGVIRGALHNGCNAMLGKIENNHKRFGVKNIAAFLHGCVSYLQRHSEDRTGLLHPTHLTEDEKRLKRNTKARKARAATKKADA